MKCYCCNYILSTIATWVVKVLRWLFLACYSFQNGVIVYTLQISFASEFQIYLGMSWNACAVCGLRFPFAFLGTMAKKSGADDLSVGYLPHKGVFFSFLFSRISVFIINFLVKSLLCNNGKGAQLQDTRAARRV